VAESSITEQWKVCNYFIPLCALNRRQGITNVYNDMHKRQDGSE